MQSHFDGKLTGKVGRRRFDRRSLSRRIKHVTAFERKFCPVYVRTLRSGPFWTISDLRQLDFDDRESICGLVGFVLACIDYACVLLFPDVLKKYEQAIP